MAIDDNSVATENKIEEKNNTDSKVPVEEAQVHDPSNGKSCHQCRQMTKEFPHCNNLKKEKLCTLKFCARCLLNRYGQNLEEVAKLEGWNCPKCRGVCNCSCCMKRKGFQPTGSLIHKAKATGYNSVHDLLHNKRPAGVEHLNVETKEESKRLKIKDNRDSKEDIVLPLGRPLTEVAGIELPAQDIGAALQFLEFCNAFSMILNIQKGQPENILGDLFEHHEVHSALVEFNIKLLSLVGKDMQKDGDAWPIKLRRCIEESQCTLDGLPMDFLDRVSSGYEKLEPSEKLKLLIFLCDEVLGTDKMRSWIAEVAAKFDEERKKNKEKVAAAKRKEKLLHQIVKDEKGKAALSAAGGTLVCVAESDARLLQLKTEAATLHTEDLVSRELVLKKNQRSDAMRTDSVMLGSNGQRLWKLGGYYSTPKIILQDIESWDSVTLQDTWSVFNEEEEKLVEEQISSLRNTKRRRPRTYDVEEEKESDSSHSPGPKDCLPQDQAETSGVAADKEAQQVEDAFDVTHANSGI